MPNSLTSENVFTLDDALRKHPPFERGYLQALHQIRSAELEGILDWFPAGATVLEIGAARGYQSSLLSKHGFSVKAIDILEENPTISYHPVQQYNGHTFPFSDSSFQVVYTSQMIAETRQYGVFEQLLAEIQRVMQPGGVSVHTIASPFNRIWTFVFHFPFTLVQVVRRRIDHYLASNKDSSRPSTAAESVGSNRTSSTFPEKLRYLVFGKNTSGNQNLWSEWKYYRRKNWIELFEAAGFIVEETRPSGLFYTGHLCCWWLPVWSRRALGSFFGSCSTSYLLRLPTNNAGGDH